MSERLDLNLLLVFDALMRERSVTRAAVRLGIGQPAASAALTRLRDLFGDVLFVRTPSGMEPTVRAQVIAEPVAAALGQLRATLDPGADFDPARARRTFSIGGLDYLGVVALPELIAGLRRDAPDIDLRLRFVEKGRLLAALQTGDIDLAVAVLAEIPKHIGSEPLLTESFVCITRPDHPAAATGLTLETYAALPHLLVTQRPDATGIVDDLLRTRSLSRRIAVTIPQVAIVPMLLAGTDLVATIGRRAAERLSELVPLRIYEPPLPLPSWRMDLIWARRNDRDAGLAWLRARLRSTVETVGA